MHKYPTTQRLFELLAQAQGKPIPRWPGDLCHLLKPREIAAELGLEGSRPRVWIISRLKTELGLNGAEAVPAGTGTVPHRDKRRGPRTEYQLKKRARVRRKNLREKAKKRVEDRRNLS